MPRIANRSDALLPHLEPVCAKPQFPSAFGPGLRISKTPFTSNGKPKPEPDHAYGKWRGRETDLLYLGDNIAPGKGRERYGHGDRELHSPVKIPAWFRASSRRRSSNTDDLVKPRSVFEHGLCCHGATSLGCEDGSAAEREVRRGKFFRKQFSDKCRVTEASSNGQIDGTSHWFHGPHRDRLLQNCH